VLVPDRLKDDQSGSTWGEHHCFCADSEKPAEAGFFCVCDSGLKIFCGINAGGAQFDRVFQRTLAFGRVFDAAVVNQPGLLQVFKGVGNGVFPPVIVQHLFAQAGGVSVQQSGQDFFLERVIDGHIFLALLV
jgi:hypothetical protein